MSVATEVDIEVETIRQNREIEHELHRLRLQRAVEQLEETARRAQEEFNLPAASAAVPGTPPNPQVPRGAAGSLFEQVHVFPNGRWS